MAKNNNNNHKEAERLKTQKLEQEKKEAEKLEAQVYKFKDEKVLGFKKRNYYDTTAKKRFLIESGKVISKDTYNSLGSATRATFCEVVEKEAS